MAMIRCHLPSSPRPHQTPDSWTPSLSPWCPGFCYPCPSSSPSSRGICSFFSPDHGTAIASVFGPGLCSEIGISAVFLFCPDWGRNCACACLGPWLCGNSETLDFLTWSNVFTLFKITLLLQLSLQTRGRGRGPTTEPAENNMIPRHWCWKSSSIKATLYTYIHAS